MTVAAAERDGRGDAEGVDGQTAGAATALPALKPNQPNHRRDAPTTIMVMSCGSIGSRPKPWRLPKTMAAATAATPALT